MKMINQRAQIGSGAAKVVSPGEDAPKVPRAFADPFAFLHKLASHFLLVVCVALLGASPGGLAAEGVPTFEEDVLPVFREKCCSCHNADKQAGGLDLTSYNRAMAGGSSGEVIAPGDAEGSYLWQLASHESEPKMPPQADRIPDSMLAVVTKWIAGGAIERKGGKAVAKKAAVSLALDPKARPSCRRGSRFRSSRMVGGRWRSPGWRHRPTARSPPWGLGGRCSSMTPGRWSFAACSPSRKVM